MVAAPLLAAACDAAPFPPTTLFFAESGTPPDACMDPTEGLVVSALWISDPAAVPPETADTAVDPAHGLLVEVRVVSTTGELSVSLGVVGGGLLSVEQRNDSMVIWLRPDQGVSSAAVTAGVACDDLRDEPFTMTLDLSQPAFGVSVPVVLGT